MEKVAVASKMIRYGGDFVRKLGQAWMAADVENQRRIEEAFPEIFQKYEIEVMA